jgi:hypothetical protein
MMARRGLMGLLAGGAAALLSGCWLIGGNSYRFKMTVEVDTPQGLRTGSSVYEVSAEKKSTFMTGNDRSKSIKGEAVAVDIAPGKTLFALLKTMAGAGDDDLAAMSMAALDPAYRNDWVESAARIAAGDGIRSPADVAPADYPMLVTFTDIRDPKSVMRVDPANFSASFGAGARLKRIVVEVTDEAVTRRIDKRLSWLEKMENHNFSRDGAFYKSYPAEVTGLRSK